MPWSIPVIGRLGKILRHGPGEFRPHTPGLKIWSAPPIPGAVDEGWGLTFRENRG